MVKYWFVTWEVEQNCDCKNYLLEDVLDIHPILELSNINKNIENYEGDCFHIIFFHEIDEQTYNLWRQHE